MFSSVSTEILSEKGTNFEKNDFEWKIFDQSNSKQNNLEYISFKPDDYDLINFN